MRGEPGRGAREYPNLKPGKTRVNPEKPGRAEKQENYKSVQTGNPKNAKNPGRRPEKPGKTRKSPEINKNCPKRKSGKPGITRNIPGKPGIALREIGGKLAQKN